MSDTDEAKGDIHREKPDLVRERQWSHGDEGFGKDCDRYDKPIFADPNVVPPPCPGTQSTDAYKVNPCGNGHWKSEGIVLRDKNSDKVVHREPTGDDR